MNFRQIVDTTYRICLWYELLNKIEAYTDRQTISQDRQVVEGVGKMRERVGYLGLS